MFLNTRQYPHYSTLHPVYTRISCFITFSKDRSRINDSDIVTLLLKQIDLSDHAPIYITINLENCQIRQHVGLIQAFLLIL